MAYKDFHTTWFVHCTVFQYVLVHVTIWKKNHFEKNTVHLLQARWLINLPRGNNQVYARYNLSTNVLGTGYIELFSPFFRLFMQATCILPCVSSPPPPSNLTLPPTTSHSASDKDLNSTNQYLCQIKSEANETPVCLEKNPIF